MIKRVQIPPPRPINQLINFISYPIKATCILAIAPKIAPIPVALFVSSSNP